MGLSNSYINNFLIKCNLTHFHGVFSADNIPKKFRNKVNASFICNLANSNISYGHFVTISMNKNLIFYCDPFGLPCTNINISNFLTSCNRQIVYNNDKIQAPESHFCGFFCILFVLLYHYPENINKISFSKKLIKNDAKCIKYICKIIQK